MAFLLKFDWLLLAFLSIITRLIPLLIHGQNSLGYDTGFYRHYINQTAVSFPNQISAGLTNNALIPRIILDTTKLTGLSADIILYTSLIIAFTICTLTFQFIIKKQYNKEAGFIAGILFIFSPVQYLGYWFFLYKNYIALIFLFLFLNNLKNFLNPEKIKNHLKSLKSWLILLLPAFAVFFSHKTTSIILIISTIISLCIYFIQKIWHKINFKILSISLIFIVLALIKITLWQKNNPYPPAIFLEWQNFLWLTAPIFFIILLNLKDIILKFLNHPFLSLFLTSSLFTILQWTFYQRIFLFLDITLLSLATLSLISFKNFYLLGNRRQKTEVAIILAIFSGWYLANFYLTVRKYTPIISQEEIAEIKKIDGLTERNATILTISDYTPWIYGLTNRKVMSPGLLEYNYNLKDWQKFWFEMNEDEKIKFLKIFPKPLYFFTIPHSQDNFLEAPCIKEKTKYLKSFECD